MRSQLRRGLLALVTMVALLAGLVPGAAAQTGGLPSFTPAPSAHFTLTGAVMVGPNMLQLAATGAQAGDTFQQDLTVTPPGGAAPIRLNAIQVGMMYYFQLTGLDGWQVIDLSKTPGNVPNIKSSIPGLNGFNPNGGQRTYEAAGPAQQAGTEQIEGTATTRYVAPVDVQKLYISLGTPAAQAAQIAAVSKMALTLWIGNDDHYIHQQQVVLNSKAPGPGGALLDVVVDFTITYRDFGAAVTITAPANAVPYAPPAPAPPPVSPPNPAPSPAPNLTNLARALLTAFNKDDEATIRSMVAPGTQFIDDPGTPLASTQSLDDWLAESRSGTVQVTMDQITQTAPDKVALDITLTGSAIPALPHPYTGRITLTFNNSGLVTAFLFITSDQTVADLAALPPPGMPTSGVADPTSLLALALGLLCLAAGLGVRRLGLVAL